MNITSRKKSDSDYSNSEPFFVSYDLGLCAALVSSGLELFSLDKKSNSKRVQFVFRRTSDIDVLVNNYWSSHMKVDARVMFENLKMLKNRIYSD